MVRNAGIVQVSGEVLRQMLGLPEGSTLHFIEEHLEHNLFEFVIEGPGMPEVAEGMKAPYVETPKEDSEW